MSHLIQPSGALLILMDIKHRYCDVMKALACIVLDNRNAAERSDAQKLQTFEFVLILVVLTKVMLAINALINVSKEKLRII